jgi:hypothetical protein
MLLDNEALALELELLDAEADSPGDDGGAPGLQ